MDIRKAESQETALIKQIMLASKAYWGYSDDWMALWEKRLSISTAFLNENEVYIAREHAQRVVGFHALKMHEKSMCELVELWVVPQRIGTGIGRFLFAHALGLARALGANEMRWEADPHAVGFYQHMGAYHIRDIDDKLEGRIPVMGIKIDLSGFSSGTPDCTD